MSRPVVHFEIVGTRPAELRQYYADLFGWTYDVGDAASRPRCARRRASGAPV